MSKTLLITGASGSLARLFASQFQDKYQFKFLTRNPKAANQYQWDIEKQTINPEAIKDVDVVIHLAGANVAGGRWTAPRKKELKDSRIKSATLIAHEAAKQGVTFEKIISASAVGYYGSQTTDKIYKETDAAAKDFLGQLCEEWEASANQFLTNELTQQVVCLRLGVILSGGSGVLDRIKIPTKLGFGSPLGSGKQYVPWIHEQDVCKLIHFALENAKISGSYNAVAPEHITNSQLTKGVANALEKPYFLPNVPSFLLKLIFGEMATVVLEGSRVSADKLLASGFEFEHPNLNEALNHLLSSKPAG